MPVRFLDVVKRDRVILSASHKTLTVLAMFSLLSGCATVSGYQRRPEASAVRDATREQYFGKGSEAGYDGAPDAAARKKARDVLVYGRMGVIQDDFQSLERALNGTGNALSSGSDLLVLALNGIGATTGGPATKAALNAASGGIIGAQGAINKDLYYQRTLPALLAQMEANTDAVRAQIIENLKLSDADYPLAAADVDLKRLVAAGSIPASVNQISKQAVDSKLVSDANIAKARHLTLSVSDTSEQITKWIVPDGVHADSERIKALQAWIDEQDDLKPHDLNPAMLEDEQSPDGLDMEPVRERAISDLNIPK